VWVIILIAVAGLCGVGCIVSIGMLTLLGSRVSSVFTTIEAATPRPGQSGGGGIVPVPNRPASGSTEEIPAPTRAAIPTTPSGGGILGGVNPDAAAVRTAEAATAEASAVNAEVAGLIASGRKIFYDELVDNRNAWFTGVFQKIENDKIEGGVFKVIWSGNGTSYELYELRQMTNFIAQVDCQVSQGGTDGSCSLVFDQKNDVGFYKFEVFDDYYRLFIVHPQGDPTTLAEGDPAGIVNAGGINHLRVIKQGEQIRIFLNEALLNTVSDSTYQSGKIGISTNSYNKSGGVEVWFDNFGIWELP